MALLKLNRSDFHQLCEPHQPLYHQLQSWERGGWVLVGHPVQRFTSRLCHCVRCCICEESWRKYRVEEKCGHWKRDDKLIFCGVSRLGPINVTTNLKHWCWCCATCRKDKSHCKRLRQGIGSATTVSDLSDFWSVRKQHQNLILRDQSIANYSDFAFCSFKFIYRYWS